jgi:hypothetical protein
MSKWKYRNCDTKHMKRALYAFGNGDVAVNAAARTYRKNWATV